MRSTLTNETHNLGRRGHELSVSVAGAWDEPNIIATCMIVVMCVIQRMSIIYLLMHDENFDLSYCYSSLHKDT